MKKLLILGIGSLTGSKLAQICKGNYDIFGTYNFRNPDFDFVNSSQIDVRNFEEVSFLLNDIKPDLVVNTCAISSVDYCENHKNEAKIVNIDFVQFLTDYSLKLGFQLTHLSSDSVFDGIKKTPYLESDKPNPPNYYGKTKLESELITMENPANLVIRASVLYGWIPQKLSEISSSSHKSLNFGQWLIQQLKEKKSVNIITDEISSPILVNDFAKSIFNLIQRNSSGLFHSSPPIQLNRFDFSKLLAESLNLDYNLIHPTTNSKLNRIMKTGFNKCLNSEKITKLINYKFLTLEESFDILKNEMMTI